MTFRVRVDNIDWYRSTPTDLDPSLPAVSVAGAFAPVPVIRIFGSTGVGERACMHIHGVFPYLYVEYPASYGSTEIFNGIFLYFLIFRG